MGSHKPALPADLRPTPAVSKGREPGSPWLGPSGSALGLRFHGVKVRDRTLVGTVYLTHPAPSSDDSFTARTRTRLRPTPTRFFSPGGRFGFDIEDPRQCSANADLNRISLPGPPRASPEAHAPSGSTSCRRASWVLLTPKAGQGTEEVSALQNSVVGQNWRMIPRIPQEHFHGLKVK